MWCKAVLDQPELKQEHQKRVMVYEAAVRGLTLLESLPQSELNHYQGSTYDFPHHLWWMSMYFFRIEEFELARRAANLGNLCVPVQPDMDAGAPMSLAFYKWQFLNDLGSCNLRLGNLKQSGIWYRKAYQFALTQKEPVREGVSYGNLGVVLSKQGKPAQAISYLQHAVTSAQKGNDRQSEFNAVVPLSAVYLQLRQYDDAFPVLQRAIAIYNSVNASVPDADSLDIIPLLAGLGEVYQYRGDLKQALYYTRLANRLDEKQRQNNEARTFRQKQEKLEAEAYRAKLGQIDADRAKAVWLRNTSITASVLLALISLIYVLHHR
nr:tetratricopeptide repeat protein [uncultured Arsenicibacter sp.]